MNKLSNQFFSGFFLIATIAASSVHAGELELDFPLKDLKQGDVIKLRMNSKPFVVDSETFHAKVSTSHGYVERDSNTWFAGVNSCRLILDSKLKGNRVRLSSTHLDNNSGESTYRSFKIKDIEFDQFVWGTELSKRIQDRIIFNLFDSKGGPVKRIECYYLDNDRSTRTIESILYLLNDQLGMEATIERKGYETPLVDSSSPQFLNENSLSQDLHS